MIKTPLCKSKRVPQRVQQKGATRRENGESRDSLLLYEFIHPIEDIAVAVVAVRFIGEDHAVVTVRIEVWKQDVLVDIDLPRFAEFAG